MQDSEGPTDGPRRPQPVLLPRNIVAHWIGQLEAIAARLHDRDPEGRQEAVGALLEALRSVLR